jgi:hypothetical protein
MVISNNHILTQTFGEEVVHKILHKIHSILHQDLKPLFKLIKLLEEKYKMIKADILKVALVRVISDDDVDLKPIKQEIDKSLPSFTIQGILDSMKTGVKQDIPVDISSYSSEDQVKINLLENSITKSCILYFLYKICNNEDKDNAFQGLLSNKLISSDKSFKTFKPIIDNNYFDSDFNSKIQKVIGFISNINSGDKVVFGKGNCSSNKELFNDVYTRLETEYTRLTKPTKQKNEIVDIKESSKYIIFFIDRTLGDGVKLNAKVEINKNG